MALIDGWSHYIFYRPYRKSISVCQSLSYNNLTLSRDKPRQENSNIVYIQLLDTRNIQLGEYPEPYIEIEAGPAICHHGKMLFLIFF